MRILFSNPPWWEGQQPNAALLQLNGEDYLAAATEKFDKIYLDTPQALFANVIRITDAASVKT